LATRGCPVGHWLVRQGVDGQVRHHDPQAVGAGVEQAADFQLVGRTPHRARALAVDEDHGGLAHRAFEHGSHAGAGAAFRGFHGRAFAEIEIERAISDVNCAASNVSGRFS
jgi:hypothetical protein